MRAISFQKPFPRMAASYSMSASYSIVPPQYGWLFPLRMML
jgi:hypothetical protein